jgi:hypothetical protein
MQCPITDSASPNCIGSESGSKQGCGNVPNLGNQVKVSCRDVSTGRQFKVESVVTLAGICRRSLSLNGCLLVWNNYGLRNLWHGIATIIRLPGIVWSGRGAASHRLGMWPLCWWSASRSGSGSGNVDTSWNFTVLYLERESTRSQKYLKNQHVSPKLKKRIPFLGLRSGSAYLWKLRGWA